MNKGQTACQAGHAFLDAFMTAQQTKPDLIEPYRDEYGIKIVMACKDLRAMLKAHDKARDLGIPHKMIIDDYDGIEDGRKVPMALGFGPATRAQADKITKGFNLMK